MALYCSTVIAVLQTKFAAMEDVVGRILPYLIKGLKSRVSEHRAASYMIAGTLASSVVMEERLVTSLLDSISKVSRSIVCMYVGVMYYVLL